MIRRAVLLLETDDGVQHGFSVDPCIEARSEWEHHYLSRLAHPLDHPGQIPERALGTVSVTGFMRSLHRMPEDVFDEPAEINPARPEIGEPR